MNEPKIPRTMQSLPRDKAFYFFTSIGNYTGESATSLDEFVRKILVVNVKSLEFHLQRGDFEKWVAETLEDSFLAGKIKQLREQNPIGIDLRDRLYLVVSKHYENLKKPRPTPSSVTIIRPKAATVTFEKPHETMETRAEK